ncbi:bifunctional GMP synthase/glutamine amidotransferase protein [Escherichia coli]|uniref:GMP synthase [glutamine-hydrolyzing] n=1 Tax=Escherichia coli TaxID=562 RepID=A0A377AGP4_ECOLX|nr:bifunctional GMP synthase/glutamine amidotransferase protein [Escherichia coli]
MPPQYVFEAGVPVFGVCYGMQTMAMQLGGHVEASNEREFGYAQVEVVNDSALVRGIEDALTADGKPLLDVWMSHGDKVTAIPSDFVTVASTESCPFAIMANEEKRFYGVQFHPEVTHTRQGMRMLERFVRDICQCEALWTPAKIIDDAVARIREQVGDDKVILGLSGGVDSSVTAMLLHRAIGKKPDLRIRRQRPAAPQRSRAGSGYVLAITLVLTLFTYRQKIASCQRWLAKTIRKQNVKSSVAFSLKYSMKKR